MADEDTRLPSDNEIASRLEAVRDKLKVDLSDADEKLAEILDSATIPTPEDPDHAKLLELSAKADALKNKRTAQQAEAARENRIAQDSNQGLGAGISIAYTILGVPLVGGIIGVVLKNQTGNPIWVSVCGLVGMILGLVGAYFVATRTRQ
jgi:F0F1-type ATP synthase assembly protein I